ncbi:unnamed protein product [Linum tenue]|uniref:Uncharacterized protein n=1 Tax=Linum tenue TaxID=586396 RepID=A0AAV0PA15_9ROSI|nr:unnamed protein product [Linum tenue]
MLRPQKRHPRRRFPSQSRHPPQIPRRQGSQEQRFLTNPRRKRWQEAVRPRTVPRRRVGGGLPALPAERHVDFIRPVRRTTRRDRVAPVVPVALLRRNLLRHVGQGRDREGEPNDAVGGPERGPQRGRPDERAGGDRTATRVDVRYERGRRGPAREAIRDGAMHEGRGSRGLQGVPRGSAGDVSGEDREQKRVGDLRIELQLVVS